jgi:transmembrane sensor
MYEEFTAPSLPVSEQAAAWFCELVDGARNRRRQRDFVRWLKASPQHIDAFLAIAMLERDLAGLPIEMEEAVRLAGEAAGPAIPLAAGGKTAAAAPRRVRRAGWLAAAAAACAAAAALWLAPGSRVDPVPVVHRTDYGEQRSVALGDGSIVTLNTLSEVAVRFGSNVRHVELVAGEAMFDVARDPRRPFVVEAGAVRLSVLGTRFAVYRKADSVRLAVLEGVVRATPPGHPEAQVLVHAGEGAIASRDGTIRRNDSIDLERATAWTERRLVFNAAPLKDVVAEFNRYNRRPLIVQDPGLGEKKITSSFFANNVGAFVAFLELDPDIEVDYGADAIRIHRDR